MTARRTDDLDNEAAALRSARDLPDADRIGLGQDDPPESELAHVTAIVALPDSTTRAARWDERDQLRCAGACGYCDAGLNCPYVGSLDPERLYVERRAESTQDVRPYTREELDDIAELVKHGQLRSPDAMDRLLATARASTEDAAHWQKAFQQLRDRTRAERSGASTAPPKDFGSSEGES